MAKLMKREPKAVEAYDPFARFERMFDEWAQMLPFSRASMGLERMQEQMIHVDQYREGDELVIKAEIPGIDPDKDVEITVSDHLLAIMAERRQEEKEEEKGYVRRELRTGSFSRTLTLPEGVSEEDIRANYDQGILEIRVPMPKAPEPATRKIPVSRA